MTRECGIPPSEPWGRLSRDGARFTRVSKDLTTSDGFKALTHVEKLVLFRAIEKCGASTGEGKYGSDFGFSPKDSAPWGISVRSHRRAMVRLEEVGFIDQVAEGGGHQKKNRYQPCARWQSYSASENSEGTEVENGKAEPGHGDHPLRSPWQELPGHGDRGLAPVVSLSSDTCSEGISSLSASEHTRVDFGPLGQEILGILEFESGGDLAADLDKLPRQSAIPEADLVEMALLARDQYPESQAQDRFDLFTGMVGNVKKNKANSPISALVSTAVEFHRGKPDFMERLAAVAMNFVKARPTPLGQLTIQSTLGKIEKEDLPEEEAVLRIVERLEGIQSSFQEQTNPVVGLEQHYAKN